MWLHHPVGFWCNHISFLLISALLFSEMMSQARCLPTEITVTSPIAPSGVYLCYPLSVKSIWHLLTLQLVAIYNVSSAVKLSRSRLGRNSSLLTNCEISGLFTKAASIALHGPCGRHRLWSCWGTLLVDGMACSLWLRTLCSSSYTLKSTEYSKKINANPN